MPGFGRPIASALMASSLVAQWAGAVKGPDEVENHRLQLSVSASGDSPGQGQDLHPGEILKVIVCLKNVSGKPLRVPTGNFRYASLRVEMPDGKVFICDPYNTYDAAKPQPWDIKTTQELEAGSAWVAADTRWRLTEIAAYGWIDAATGQRLERQQTINFRKPGVYRVSAEFRVGMPVRHEGDGKDDFWTGSLESAVSKFTVEELPVEKRLAEATEEQRRWLTTVLTNGEGAAAAMTHLEWAVTQTKNEGLAKAMLAAARDPANREHRGILLFWVTTRACDPFAGRAALGIDGPYLKELAEAALEDQVAELERRCRNEVASGAILPYSAGYATFLKCWPEWPAPSTWPRP